MQYEPHPAAEIFPMMSDEEFAGLVEDIREHGLREPIILFEGKVLDGRNRLKACEQTGVDPRFEEWPNGEDPRHYVVSKNLHRRHLNESQRAMVAARMANINLGENQHTGGSPNLGTPKITLRDAAKQLNVAHGNVSNARFVMREGDENEVAAIDAGDASVFGTAEHIRKRKNGIKETPYAPERNRARQVRIPAGMTFEDACRKGMEMEQSGMSAEDVAKALGVDKRSYRDGRDIVRLSDMGDLPAKDAEVVEAAVRDMNENRRIAVASEMTKHIVRRIWGDGYRSGEFAEKTAARRVEDFERAFGHIVQACTAADQIEIPHIGEDRARRAVGELREALRHARNLVSKLEELYQ